LHIGHLVPLERSNFAYVLGSSGEASCVPNFFKKMIVKILTYMHMVFYTWWCWHNCKGEDVGVGVDQLREERKVFR
jgi:hypothetical protein